jgi:hypothetical protein
LKLTKTSWIMLSVGICVILFAGLGVARSQQLQEQDQLKAELEVAEMRLDKFQIGDLSSQTEELAKQLKQTELQIRSAKARLAVLTGSIAASDAFFDIAQTCGVEVTEISSPGRAKDDFEGLECLSLLLVVTVEGDVSNLINFVAALNRDFPTGMVKSVEVNVPEVVDEEEGEEGDGVEAESVKPSAEIQLFIYSYRGD